MKSNHEAIEYLQRIERRYSTFKRIFNTFQQEILRLEAAGYPVNGIAVDTTSETLSTVSFGGRSYEIEFDRTSVEGEQKGKVSCYRRIDEENRVEVTSIIFNGNGEVDVPVPDGEDPIMLNEDVCSAQVVLNFLCDDADA